MSQRNGYNLPPTSAHGGGVGDPRMDETLHSLIQTEKKHYLVQLVEVKSLLLSLC
jgi:hypothetical protein